MLRPPIPAEARQVIYNVYLYFLNEAEAFKKFDDGYFQKVQERVVEACRVSRGFLQSLLKEKGKNGDKVLKDLPAPITRAKKRKADEDEHSWQDSDTESSDEDEEEAVPTKRLPVTLSIPPKLALLPPLTPISPRPAPPELATIVKNTEMPRPIIPFDMKSETPPPLAPLVKSEPAMPPPALLQPATPVFLKPYPPKPKKPAVNFIPKIKYDPPDFEYVSMKRENVSAKGTD